MRLIQELLTVVNLKQQEDRVDSNSSFFLVLEIVEENGGVSIESLSGQGKC